MMENYLFNIVSPSLRGSTYEEIYDIIDSAVDPVNSP